MKGDEEMPEFKDRLKQMRQSAGLTQSELAEKLGVSTSTVSMYEVGSRKPSFEILEQLADFFNVDTDYLMGKASRSVYYLDPETAKLAQELKDNPGQRTLFDASKDLSPDDIKVVMTVINGLKKKEGSPQ